MKISCLLLLCFSLILGCKKPSEEPFTDPAPIIGSWRWVLATGGLLNVYMTPQNSGHTWSLTLNYGYTYSQTGTLHGGPISGSYSLHTESNGGWNRNVLHVHKTSTVDIYSISFIGDTLRLDNQIELDGLSYFLVRQ